MWLLGQNKGPVPNYRAFEYRLSLLPRGFGIGASSSAMHCTPAVLLAHCQALCICVKTSSS